MKKEILIFLYGFLIGLFINIIADFILIEAIQIAETKIQNVIAEFHEKSKGFKIATRVAVVSDEISL